MKGSSLYGKVNLNRGGQANRPDGRAKSSAFQKDEEKNESKENKKVSKRDKAAEKPGAPAIWPFKKKLKNSSAELVKVKSKKKEDSPELAKFKQEQRDRRAADKAAKKAAKKAKKNKNKSKKSKNWKVNIGNTSIGNASNPDLQ